MICSPQDRQERHIFLAVWCLADKKMQQIVPYTYPTDNMRIVNAILCIIPLNKFGSKAIELYGSVSV